MALPSHRKDSGVRIIQLTDPHIGPNPEYRLANTRTCESFRRVLSCLNAPELEVDLLLVTGDIVNKGQVESYHLFDREISKLGIPFHWLPGNHDDLDIMDTISAPFQREIRAGNWLLLMLNSAQAGKVGGRLSEQELRAAVTAAKGHKGPVAIFVHHPPIPVGCAWLDKQRIANGDDMLALLADCGNIQAIFTGHVHQTFHARVKDMEIYTAPSTCFQFEAGSDEFALGDDGPGYRWIDFRNDGTFATGVVQLTPTSDQLSYQGVGY